MTLAQRRTTSSAARGTSSQIIAGAVLWLAAAVFFLVMAVSARFADYFPADLHIAHAIQDIDVPAFGGFVDFLNFIGETKAYFVLIIVFAIGLGALRAGWEALLVLFSIGPAAIGAVVKDLVDQARPSAALIHVTAHEGDPGFPSGHVLKTAALFLVLLVVVPAVVPWRPGRWLVQAGCLLLIVAAGPARVYAGAHWPSETLASYLLVVLTLGPLLAAYVRLRRRSELESGA